MTTHQPPAEALRGILVAHLSWPVYERLHDSMAIPAAVVWPDNDWVTPGTFCDLEWRYRVTVLALRADLDGAVAATERAMLDVIAAPLHEIGAQWTRAGDWRTEQVGGVDYIAADMLITVHNDQPPN